MAQCSKCRKQIERYPCPHCGHDGGEALFGKKEGGTGGGQP